MDRHGNRLRTLRIKASDRTACIETERHDLYVWGLTKLAAVNKARSELSYI